MVAFGRAVLRFLIQMLIAATKKLRRRRAIKSIAGPELDLPARFDRDETNER